jgi:hypothetical protein
VDLIKKILLESFKNDPHVNGLLEKSKNKFKLNVLIDYVLSIHFPLSNSRTTSWAAGPCSIG